MSSSASVGMVVGLNLVKFKHAMKNICKETISYSTDDEEFDSKAKADVATEILVKLAKINTVDDLTCLATFSVVNGLLFVRSSQYAWDHLDDWEADIVNSVLQVIKAQVHTIHRIEY